MAGPVAVTYFFVLSGFIMTMVYGDLRLDGARDYWWARFARIYPVYLLGLACSTALAGIFGRDADPVGQILSLLLVQSWVPGYALSANIVGWSLSVEVFFYLLFPALIVLARRIGLARWCAGVVAFWLVAQAWAVFASEHIAGPYRSPSHQFVNYFPLPYLSCFLVGITAGLLVRRNLIMLRPTAAFGLAFGSLSLVATALLLDWPTGVPKQLGLLAPVFAVSIVALYFLPSRGRSSAPARLLGEASYALYILHWPLAPLLQHVTAPSLGLSAFGGFWFTVAVLVGLSVVVFRWIETPARAALRQRAAMAAG